MRAGKDQRWYAVTWEYQKWLRIKFSPFFGGGANQSELFVFKSRGELVGNTVFLELMLKVGANQSENN